MRDEYAQFTEHNAVILAVGPDIAAVFRQYWQKENLPFVGLPDPLHRVASLYRQEVNLFKLGRMPLLCIVDSLGYIRYIHHADSMTDIPSNKTLLQAMHKIQASA